MLANAFLLCFRGVCLCSILSVLWLRLAVMWRGAVETGVWGCIFTATATTASSREGVTQIAQMTADLFFIRIPKTMTNWDCSKVPCQLIRQKQVKTPCAWCKMSLTSHWCCSCLKILERAQIFSAIYIVTLSVFLHQSQGDKHEINLSSARIM